MWEQRSYLHVCCLSQHVTMTKKYITYPSVFHGNFAPDMALIEQLLQCSFEGLGFICGLHFLIIGPSEARDNLMAREGSLMSFRPKNEHSFLYVYSNLMECTTKKS